MNWLADGLAYLFDGSNWSGDGGLGQRLVEHIVLSAAVVVIGVLVAVPAGLWIGHTGRGSTLVINIGNIGRAVPVYAAVVLLVLAPAPFGVANLTRCVVTALVLFCIPPLLTNTYVGMREVDRDLVEAATGMGMTGSQVLRRVELPLAMPLILNGVRLAAVQTVATATIAGLVGGGGLGRTINAAFVAQDRAALVAGSLLVTLLALATEVLLAVVQRGVDLRRRADRAARRSGTVVPGVELTVEDPALTASARARQVGSGVGGS